MGMCVPKACQQEDVRSLGKALAAVAGVNRSLEARCEDETLADLAHFAPHDWAFFAAIAAILLAAAVGTGWDVVQMVRETRADIGDSHLRPGAAAERNNNADDGFRKEIKCTEVGPESNVTLEKPPSGALHPVLKCFSIRRNWKELFTQAPYSSTGKVYDTSCLDGLRVITMASIVLGHMFQGMCIPGFDVCFTRNINAYTKHLYSSFGFGYLLETVHQSVDTFFFIGALLVAKAVVPRLQVQDFRFSRHLPYEWFMLRRWLRLTPVYFFLLMAYWVLLPRAFPASASEINLHPLIRDIVQEPCRKYWWLNLIYLSNYNPKPCMPWGWYLSVDMQLYALSPAFLYVLLRRSKKVAGAVFGVTTVLCWALRGLGAGLAGTPVRAANYGMNITATQLIGSASSYFMPWGHVPTYLIGILAGYFLVSTSKWPLSRRATVAGWFLSAALWISYIYAKYDPEGKGITNPVLSILYHTFNTTIWTVIVAWVVLACAAGHGGPVGWILSSPRWQPWARLTLIVYLLHEMVVYPFYGQLGAPVQMTDFTMAIYFFGMLVLLFSLAVPIYILVEAPAAKLIKLMERRLVVTKANDKPREPNVGVPREEYVPLPMAEKFALLEDKIKLADDERSLISYSTHPQFLVTKI